MEEEKLDKRWRAPIIEEDENYKQMERQFKGKFWEKDKIIFQ